MDNRQRQNNGSISSRESQKSKGSSDSGVVLDLDPDFVPVKIHVFKNGDQFDVGTEVVVTRREFKHWFGFLDFISKKIKSMKTITKLYLFSGDEVEGFDELENNGQYVACYDAFKQIEYGKAKKLNWRPVSRQVNYNDPYGIDSHESLEIHLKKLGFESETGASFPDDNPASQTRGKNHRLIAPGPMKGRRNSITAPNPDKKHHKETTSLSLPKIGTSNNMTTEPYDYDGGNRRKSHRADSDPESNRRRGHRSQSQDHRRNSYDRRRYDEDDYERRRRHRSYRESSKRDYSDKYDKNYKSDDKYYASKYSDKYYKEDDKYYKSDDKDYNRDYKYYKSDDKEYKRDDKYYKNDDKDYKRDDKYYKNDDKDYKRDDKYYQYDDKDYKSIEKNYKNDDKYNKNANEYDEYANPDKNRRRSKRTDADPDDDRYYDDSNKNHEHERNRDEKGVYM